MKMPPQEHIAAHLLYETADRRSKMRFAAWQGGTPGIVNGFTSLEAGRSTQGTGLSAEAGARPSGGPGRPRRASLGPPGRGAPPAKPPTPAGAQRPRVGPPPPA